MSSRQILVKDFEWASVARYIVEISAIIGLREMNWSMVHSFPYARLGPDKLRSMKVKHIYHLTEGLDAIKAYVAEHKDDVGQEELTVLRSLHKQYFDYKELCEDHLKRVETFRVLMNHEIEYADLVQEVDSDEPPF